MLVVAGLAALLGVLPLSAQSTAGKRTPPAPSSATAQKRKPPAPPAQAVSRRKPPAPPPVGTLRYPFVPFFDFDFVYRFPYGVDWYGRFGHPEYPYRFVFPPPGCVTSDLEAHGDLRVDVPQREAETFVDGFYAGIVDDFDGSAEHVNLTPGPHHIELRASGFETATFDVNIEAGRTIVYRTPMRAVVSTTPPRL
jgi:hypothetical protein